MADSIAVMKIEEIKKFDQTGRLTDEMTQQKVEEFVIALTMD